MITDNKISKDYFWLNQPQFEINNNRLHITSSPNTDFWQRTHYNFQRDNGHCLLTEVKKEFSITVKTEFYPQSQYDQCGLIIRIDSENWIKTSIEYETETHSRLGSVVTNQGFSDWATIDINSKINTMWYRFQSKQNDILIEYSNDGLTWKQLRITHLLCKFHELNIGIYACSPMDSSFESIFDNFSIENSLW
ncbi:MAG: DUF1349 domain-containing protein [Spirochaetes bacterium]|jgi:regulation of enolase protein 1 (concanavalin A-like superfamily)|nr:DUF1349 domain-containing protein [Spirochaetota bacterium]